MLFVPWKESYDKSRQCIKKQRYYFAYKVPYTQNYGFSSSHVSMWKLDHKEGWALKADVFEFWCWRRLLRVHSTAKSNQFILKEISPEYSLEGLMLKLKLQYFGHLMQRANSLEKTLMLGNIAGRRRRGGIEDEMVGWHHRHELNSSRRWWRTGNPGMLQSKGSQRVGHDWTTEQQIVILL